MTVDIQLFFMGGDPIYMPVTEVTIAKVRKLVRSETGDIVAKYGLSAITGDWIQVREGEAYPDECMFKIKRGIFNANNASRSQT